MGLLQGNPAGYNGFSVLFLSKSGSEVVDRL